jgi:uncharacterized protein (TIGR03437 family)
MILRKIWIALTAGMLFSAAAWAQTTPLTVTYSYSGLPLPIFTSSANLITIAGITVPRALTITHVSVQVQIQYPNSGDLKIYMFSPQGTRSILLEHDCSVANVDTTFDDGASTLWKDSCPVEAGRGPFRSDQPLSNSYGDNSSFGLWTLAVTNDQSQSRAGWITQFSVTITGIPQFGPVTTTTAVANSASISATGAIAPGEMISVYGSSVGPAIAVSAPVGALPTSLGGSSVTINDVTAPIAYASQYRLDVQVPFSVTPGSSATVQVNTGSGSAALRSAPISVPVNVAVPAIYTNGVAGTGPAAASNQDGKANTLLNPAPRGSIVTIYASGLGAVSPAILEGAVPPLRPLSAVTGDVGAFIGGVPSTVQFAGAAPLLPGTFAINIQVPPSARVGAQELVIYSNGISSQKGVTIYIAP